MDTDASQSAQDLQARESQLRAIIDGVHDHAISLVDLEGRIVTWNAAAERIKGYTLSEVRGHHIRMLFVEEDRAHGLPEHELEVARRVGHWQGDGWRRRKDGTTFPAHVSVSALHEKDGEVTGFVKVTQDVSERRRMEDALRISEARLSTTLHSIGDAVIATDATGCVTFMNPVAESLTRWTASDASGRLLPQVFHIVNEYTRQPVESPVDKVLREGVVVGLANHTALIARDGTEISIADSGAPIRDSRGGIAGVVLVFRDVTEERLEHERERLLTEATAQLAASLDYGTGLRSLAHLLVPGFADACVIELLDARGELSVFAVAHAEPENLPSARDLAERSPNDLSPSPISSRVARTGVPELIGEVNDAMLAAFARTEEQRRPLRGVGFTSCVSAPLRARGRVLGVMTSMTAGSRARYASADLALAAELSRRAALALDNARLYAEAQEANQIKDEFLATVSHELRTPLTAMLGWTRMLRAGAVAEHEEAHALEVIERNAIAQVRLIEDLLDVSRVISGKLRLNIASVDLARVAESALEAVHPAADAKGVRLVASLEHDSALVVGDADRLQQIVWNLLTNAVKFTPRGGSVELTLQRVNSAIELRVIDTGEGIPPGFLPYVFERFRQADASRSRAHGGLGLGLAIVRHLVELHGGTVHVQSPGLGRGATFSLSLPVAPRLPDHGSALDEPRRPTLEGYEVPTSLDGLRLLVVEDDADTRELLSLLLEAAGAQVETWENAASAFERFRRAPPDVLVSDIGMPGMDGHALIRAIRELPPERGGTTPAIALTAFARVEDRKGALAAGFDRHLVKPVEPNELVFLVAKLAGRVSAD